MADTAAFAHINLADSAAITVSSQETDLPGSFLQNVHVERRWRSQSDSDDIIIDLGANTLIDTIGLFGTTMSAIGTARVLVSTQAGGSASGDLYTESAVVVDDDYNCRILLLPAPVSGRYVRIYLEDIGAAYVSAGRPFVGQRTALSYNFGYGWQRGRVDRSRRDETAGGQTQVWRDNSYRTLDVTFQCLTEAERNGLVEQIDLLNGTHTDVLFIIDPASSNLARDSIFGLMAEMTAVEQSFLDIFTKQYKIKERL